MSAPHPDRDAEMFALLAEYDLAAVAHVHAKLLAANEPEEVNGLGRTYQKVARSLRQTLMLKQKAAREQAGEAARAAIFARREAITREDQIAARTMALQDGLDRIAGAAIEDPERREATLDRFDVEIDDWIDEPDFLTADLDAQLRRACRLLNLPERLVDTWRALPRPAPPDLPDDPPADAPSPDAPTADVPPPSPPWRSSS
jgi:hypothetical protein